MEKTYIPNISCISNILDYFEKLSQSPQAAAPSSPPTPVAPMAAPRSLGVPHVHPSQYRFLDRAAVSAEPLSISEYHMFRDFLDWDVASRHIETNVAPLFFAYINWSEFLKTHPIGVAEINRIGIKPRWLTPELLLTYQPLLSEEIEVLTDVMDTEMWHVISRTQNLDEWFMDKYAEQLDWEEIFTHQRLRPEFRARHAHRVSADYLELFAMQLPQ